MDTKSFQKLKRKQTFFGVLKTIAYFAGFPLFVLYVVAGSVQFMHFDIMAKTWYIGIGLALLPWLLVSILQIIFGRFATSQHIKTLVVGVFAVVCLLGSAGIIDVVGQSRIDAVTHTYVQEDGVTKTNAVPTYKWVDGQLQTQDWVMTGTAEIPTYNYLKGHYVTTTKHWPSELDGFRKDLEYFCLIYNVQQRLELKKETKVDGQKGTLNTDGSFAPIDKATGLPVNPNGLIAEGFIYTADFAVDVLITYYEARDLMAAHGLDIEAEYQKVLKQVKLSDEYTQYMQSAEYQEAYGEGGYAYNYMLNEDRLNQMIPVLAKYLSFALKNNTYGTVLGSLIDLNALSNVTNVDELMTFVDGVLATVGGLGIQLPPDIAAMLNKETLLAMLEGATYYYAPTVRPAFDFIGEATDGDAKIGEYSTVGEDGTQTVFFSAEQMHAFALARFYAKEQGALIGSVLVGNNDTALGGLLNADNHIGQITMDSTGYAPEYAWTLDELYQLRAELDYVPDTFPLLAARRFMYTFSGLVALSIILFYQFSRREEDMIVAMTQANTAQGGAQQ